MGFALDSALLAQYPSYLAEMDAKKNAVAQEWKRFTSECELSIEVAKRSERLKALIHKGIPDKYRGEEQPPNAVAARDIEKDVGRTFPEQAFFASDEGVNMLRRVLLAYAARNPALGYCQGMNFLAAFILLWLAEEQAFWLLCYVVEEVLPDHFGRNMTGSLVDQKVFLHFLQKVMPRVSSRLVTASFPFSALTTGWFCCIFVNTLPKTTALRVWDLVFVEGPQVVFLAALAIFKANEQALLAETEAYTMMDLLRNYALRCYDPDFLFRIALEDVYGKIASDKDLSVLRFNYWLSSEAEVSLTAKTAQIAKLKNSVKLSADELHLLYKQYNAAVLNSFTHEGLDIAVFHEIIQKIAPHWPEDFVRLETLFEAFDYRGDQVLDFEELIFGLNTLLNGEDEAKLQLYFRCIDRNRDGYITQAEFQAQQRQLSLFLHALLPPLSSVPEGDKISFERWKEATAGWRPLLIPLLTAPPVARLSLA